MDATAPPMGTESGVQPPDDAGRRAGTGRGKARSPGRPRDPHVDAAVAEAVAELLAEIGYAGLTIEGVAARAGVAKSTVYRRWSAKRDLVADALETRARTRVRAPDTGGLRSDLLEHLRGVNAALDAPVGRAIVALVTEARYDPELGRALREGFVAGRRAEVGEILARARARGELRDDVDPELIIDLLVSPLWYRALVWGESLADEALQRVVDVLVPAIAPTRG
jgi:AcrR family transcriptional regulator